MEISTSYMSLSQLESDLRMSSSDERGSVGQYFQDFRIVGELNGGATARVYEAADRNGGAHVALKVLNSKPCGGFVLPPSIIQQEINCAKCLDHKHIAKLVDVVAHDGRLALAFELVRGPDLLDYIKGCHNRVPEQLGLYYFRQLLSAVSHMHQRGIAHRDLKPENCMVDPQAHVLKVIDFGLAAPLEAQMPPGCGTLSTIAPECIVQEGSPPAQDAVAVDVWGLGVTLYITLVGKFPFQDMRRPHSDQQQVYNTLKGRLNPFPDRVSSGARDLILSMLQTDPADRPSLQEIAAHPCLAETDMREAFQQEARLFGGASGMGPYSPSCESAASDQSCVACPVQYSTPADSADQHRKTTANSLNYMLERYLTTNAADKRRPAISQGETILKNGMAGASGLQPEKCSALQPEIVQAALRSSPEPFDSRISTQTSSPMVVSVFSEASQSQGFFMDEDYSGLPLEENPVQERQSVKLFTMSQEDLSPRRSHDLPKAETSGRSEYFSELPSVPEEDEREAFEDCSPSVPMSGSSSDRSLFSFSYPASDFRCGPSLRQAYSQDLDRPPPLGPRYHRATMTEYPAQMAACTMSVPPMTPCMPSKVAAHT